jgi:hypothetical protein
MLMSLGLPRSAARWYGQVSITLASSSCTQHVRRPGLNNNSSTAAGQQQHEQHE